MVKIKINVRINIFFILEFTASRFMGYNIYIKYKTNRGSVRMENKNKNEKQGVTISKKAFVIIITVFLLFVAGGVVLGMNWNNWFGNKPVDAPAISQNNPDIDPNAGDWNGQQLEDKGGASKGIKIPGYPSITISKDTRDVTVAFLNPEGNPCYFKFELFLKDSEERIYTSKLVPPGKAITNITLSKALSEGEYDATIKISTYSLTDQSPMNGANVETVLIAK